MNSPIFDQYTHYPKGSKPRVNCLIFWNSGDGSNVQSSEYFLNKILIGKRRKIFNIIYATNSTILNFYKLNIH